MSKPAPPPPPQPPPTPSSPWIISEGNGTLPCPSGYDFHVTLNGQTPWCANSSLDPHPRALLESPWTNDNGRLKPDNNTLGCSSRAGGCIYPGKPEWGQALAYLQCVQNGGVCVTPQVLPAIGPSNPYDTGAGWQVFPKGPSQEQAYEEQVRANTQAVLSHLRDLGDAINKTAEARAQYQAMWDALWDVNSPQSAAAAAGAPDPYPDGNGDGTDGEAP